MQGQIKNFIDIIKQRVFTRSLLLILLISMFFGFILTRNVDKDSESPSVSYLSSEDDILCVRVEDAKLQQTDIFHFQLQCENVQTGEVKIFTLPEAYKNASSIRQSPDGKKLLIEHYEGTVVTDLDFNDEKTVYEKSNYEYGGPQLIWADNSKNLLISEIGREDNDADFLPEPIVVSMLNLDSGEKKRVYKTGEYVDVSLINVLGSNDEFVFISLPATKNWVAKETNPPPAIINAIRIDDGAVHQVNSHKIGPIDEISYLGENRFVFTHRGEVGIEGEAGIVSLVVAQLENNEYGLGLRKVLELSVDSDDVFSPVLLSSKGILVWTVDTPSITYSVMQDDGSKSNLKLDNVGGPYSSGGFSSNRMPDLPPAP